MHVEDLMRQLHDQHEQEKVLRNEMLKIQEAYHLMVNEFNGHFALVSAYAQKRESELNKLSELHEELQNAQKHSENALLHHQSNAAHWEKQCRSKDDLLQLKTSQITSKDTELRSMKGYDEKEKSLRTLTYTQTRLRADYDEVVASMTQITEEKTSLIEEKDALRTQVGELDDQLKCF